MAFLTIPILGLLTIALLATYKYIIHPTFISALSKVPSAHWSAPISPLWILYIRYKCRENRTLHAAHKKLGGVIRIGPNELSVNDVGGLRTVYSGGFEKGEWYSIFDNYGVPCMFSTWHSRTHSARKRMISNIYSKSSIHNSLPAHNQAQDILYNRLLPILKTTSEKEEEWAKLDIHDIFNATSMDFITAYLFGRKNASDFLDDAYRGHWFDLYHSRKTYTFFPQELPGFTAFCKKLGIYLVPTWVDDANRQLEAWTANLCEGTLKYIKSGEAEKDTDPANEPVVFSSLLNGIQKEEKLKGTESVLYSTTLKYPDLSLSSEMIDHLAAGHETSGITLTYIAWHLSQDVALQNTLREELLSLSPNMLLTPTSSQEKPLPNSKELDALPILHSVMMETLRLQAAIPGNQPRMTPFPSCEIGGFRDIPGGVRIGAQAYSVHRNAEVFPEPEKWDWKRFLDVEGGNVYSEEMRRERDRWFWAFSSGGRMCVGSNFAVHEIKLVIAAIYSNFRTYIVDDKGIEQTDGYTCGPAGNKLWLKFERVKN